MEALQRSSLQVAQILHHAAHTLKQPLHPLPGRLQRRLQLLSSFQQLRVLHDGLAMHLRRLCGQWECGQAEERMSRSGCEVDVSKGRVWV